MANPLRILVVGDLHPDDPSLYYAAALQKLEHDVETLRVPEIYQPSRLNLWVNQWLRRLAPTPDYWGLIELNERLIAETSRFRPNLVLFFHPLFIRYQTLARMRSVGALLFSWFSGDAFDPKNASRDFYDAIRHYDFHFTTTSFNVPELLRNGARATAFLPRAVASQYYYPVAPTSADRLRFGADIGFVGEYPGERAAQWLERLAAANYTVKVFGPGWERLGSRAVLWKQGAIDSRIPRGETFSRVVNSFRITLGLATQSEGPRALEIAACGGFLLQERTQEFMEIFRPGEGVMYFDDFNDLQTKIERYRSDEQSRRLISVRGFDRSRRPDLSYESRAKDIVIQYRLLAAEEPHQSISSSRPKL